MSKKTDKNEATAVDQVAKLEEERRKAIAEFNVQNMGKFWIDPDKVPTDEDIENPEIVAKDIHSKMYAYVQATMKAMCGLAGMPSLFIPELPLEKPRTNAEEK